MSEQFKVLATRAERAQPRGLPEFIPWSLIEPHRAQAARNHYQSLETLNRRGGLGLLELYAVLQDSPYAHDIPHGHALAFLLGLLETAT